jgi:hypothetical protein
MKGADKECPYHPYWLMFSMRRLQEPQKTGHEDDYVISQKPYVSSVLEPTT